MRIYVITSLTYYCYLLNTIHVAKIYTNTVLRNKKFKFCHKFNEPRISKNPFTNNGDTFFLSVLGVHCYCLPL